MQCEKRGETWAGGEIKRREESVGSVLILKLLLIHVDRGYLDNSIRKKAEREPQGTQGINKNCKEVCPLRRV